MARFFSPPSFRCLLTGQRHATQTRGPKNECRRFNIPPRMKSRWNESYRLDVDRVEYSQTAKHAGLRGKPELLETL